MTLAELVDIIATEVGKPFDYPTQVMVKKLILSARAKLIRDQYVKTNTYPLSAVVQICIDMKNVNSTECCGLDLGCSYPTSTQKLPLPIDVKDMLNFSFVGSINGIKPFTYLKPEEIQYIKVRKFSSKRVYWTWINRYIIVFNLPGLRELKVRYVPADPTELMELSDCAGKPCYDIDDATVIENHWEDAITRIVVPKLIGTKPEQIPLDEVK